jgi:hypothetical protein
MQAAPLVVLEVPRRRTRALRIYREYVEEPLSAGTPAVELRERFCNALDRIRRSWGASVTRDEGNGRSRIRRRSGERRAPSGVDRTAARGTIDPMYDHQLTAKRRASF